MCSFILPIKPHLQKYLLKKLRCKGNDIVLTYNDQIGFGLFVSDRLISKRNFDYFGYKTVIEKYCKELGSDHTVKVKLRSYHEKFKEVNLTENGIYYTNKWLEKIFRLEMFTFINTQFMFYPRIDVTYAINDFLSLYDIGEDDISHETLYKIWKRHKKNYSYTE